MEGVLAPSSNCSILIEISMAGKANRENDLSIVLGATMDLTNTIIRLILLPLCQSVRIYDFDHLGVQMTKAGNTN